MDIKEYPHIELTVQSKINIVKIPTIRLEFNPTDVNKFNEVFDWVKSQNKDWDEITWTRSGGISVDKRNGHLPQYGIRVRPTSIELVILALEGQYRFIIGIPKYNERNTITGRQAYIEFKKMCDKHNINLENMAIENGDEIKTQIQKPRIEVEDFGRMFIGQGHNIENCHHMDFNSAYFANICKEYPEFYPACNELFTNRKENNGFYKDVLTHAQGFFQSKWCNINSHKFALAHLAKAGINGTRADIDLYIEKLKEAGRLPLLSNTDGIWYCGDVYHDENEGKELGQWKNDHINCKLNIKSQGAYQFIEDGKIHVVVRGLTTYDKINPDRESWNWDDIYKGETIKFTFNYKDGIKLLEGD